MSDYATLKYEHNRGAMISYLKLKLDEGDFHAVSDAANDLRVMEAVHAVQKPSPESEVCRNGEKRKDVAGDIRSMAGRDTWRTTAGTCGKTGFDVEED